MLLHTDALTKDYGSVRALDQLTLQVQPGEIFGLLGPNGSGKSTAIRLMLGFLKPSSGTARIADKDCWHDSREVRRHVGYLPGELRLYENMTGRQLIDFLGRLRDVDFAHVERLALRLDIDLARPLAQLSSGMKRKIALISVLITKAPLLILDEPTNTLDPTMRDQLLVQLLEAKAQGQAVLFSSHVLVEVERVCDRVGILQRGRLVHLQEMSELRQVRRIRGAFDGPVETIPQFHGLHRAERAGNEITLEYEGPLPPVLEWMAQHKLVDMHVEPLGLSEIYHRYHGAEE